MQLEDISLTSARPREKLIIELDGSQHLQQLKEDEDRTVYLESKGYCVLRFWNNDVSNDIEAVMRKILDAIELK